MEQALSTQQDGYLNATTESADLDFTEEPGAAAALGTWNPGGPRILQRWSSWPMRSHASPTVQVAG